MLRAAATFGVVTLLSCLSGSETYAQAGTEQSCTAQWLAKRKTLPAPERYERKTADAFGRECLRVHGKEAINWGQVKQQLAELITSAYSLNTVVPADIAVFCPGYVGINIEQRRDFWREFALQVIKPEAGTDAHALMWEQPYDSRRRPVGGEYSIGLLQLSISNRSPYGCDIPDEARLLDPKTNLACGVRILSYLVSREGIGGNVGHGRSGAARYWSTLRVISAKPGAAGKMETRQPIIAAVRQLPQCR